MGSILHVNNHLHNVLIKVFGHWGILQFLYVHGINEISCANRFIPSMITHQWLHFNLFLLPLNNSFTQPAGPETLLAVCEEQWISSINNIHPSSLHHAGHSGMPYSLGESVSWEKWTQAFFCVIWNRKIAWNL